MRVIDILIITLVFLSGFIWFFLHIAKQKLKQVDKVSVEEIVKRLEGEEEIIIIDIREKKDFNNFLGHIVHSVNIPFRKLKERLKVDGLDLSRFFEISVVIVEQSESLKGVMAYKMLKAQGFKRVEVLDGGFAKWLNLQLPVTRYEV